MVKFLAGAVSFVRITRHPLKKYQYHLTIGRSLFIPFVIRI